MSLIAWYPLNGDLRDHTKNNGEIIAQANVKWDANGKIGKSYKAELENTFIRINNPLKLAKKFSIAFWMKESAAKTWSDIFAFTNGVDSNSCRLEKISVEGKYVWYMNGCFSSGAVLFTRESDKWEHITLTCDGTKVYCYKNGIETYNANINVIDYLPNYDYIHISRRDAGAYWDGNLNDFRIYDHALSVKEVKEIAKAKILHYKFNDMQEPTTNLIYSLGKHNSNWAPYNDTVITNLKQKHEFINNEYWQSTIEWDDCVSSSYLMDRGLILKTIGIGGSADAASPYPGRTFSYAFDMRYEGDSDLVVIDNVAQQVTIKSGNEHKFRTIYTVKSNHLQVQIRPLKGGGKGKLVISRFMLEEKDHHTPYCIKNRTGKVMDTSGYNNHSYPLEETTTPQWTSDSKTGMGCYRYKDKPMKIECVQSPMKVNQFSFSMWINEASYLAGYPLFKSNSLLFHLSKDNEVRVRCCNDRLWAYEISCDTGIRTGWHHFVYTFNNGIQKLYYDSKLLNTENAGQTSFDWSDDILSIGYRYDGGVYPNLNASLDDIRIYASALSDNDIEELYSVRASISKQGTVFAECLNEKSFYNETIKADNLLTNGFAELKDNTNFPGMTYCATDGYSKLGCFERAGGLTLQTSENIPVDWDQIYEVGGYLKSVDPAKLSDMYMGMVCLDDKLKEITFLDVNHYTATRTTLAKAINNGDTTIQLTSAASWTVGTAGVEHHTKHIGIYDRPEATNYERNSSYIPYLSISGNVLTLKSPWTKGTVPIGTKVANSYSGSGYQYICGSGTIPATWKEYKGKANKTNFRFGTKYIKFLWLVNYNQNSTYKVRGADIYIKNISTMQSHPTQITTNIEKTGTLKAKTLNEVGIIDGLIAYYPLDNNTNDYSGNKYHCSSANVSQTDGIINGAYLFDSVSGIKTTLSVPATSSVSVWAMRPSNTPNRMIFSFNGDAKPDGPDLFLLNNTICWNTGDSAVASFKKNGVNVVQPSANEWHHYVVVNNALLNKCILYVDGLYYGETVFKTTLQTNKNFVIGAYYDNKSGYVWQGKIDEVKIYNRALTEKEVGLLFNHGIGKVSIEKTGEIYANLFDEITI